MSDRVPAEQLDYYDQRAAEYDDWWLRRGRYDAGRVENARWAAELAEVAAPRRGRVRVLAHAPADPRRPGPERRQRRL